MREWRIASGTEDDVEPRRSRAGGRLLASIALLAAALSLGAALRSAWQQDWTYDEADHLSYSRRLLATGETERNSELQWNSKTPAVVPNVLSRQLAIRYLGASDPERRKLAARLPTLLWLLGLLATVWLVGRRLAGAAAGHMALVLAAVEPNLVANASIATVDVAFTLAGGLTLVAGFALASRPDLRRSLLLGLALGSAFVIKFSAFVLLPLLLVAAAIALRGVPRPRRTRAAAAIALWTGIAGLLAAAVLCAGYGWAGVGEPLSSRPWRGEPMSSLARIAPGLRAPLPIDFLAGVDITVAQERSKEWPVLMLGETRSPRFYYFPLQWAIKTPIALACAQVVGLALLLRSRTRSAPILFAAVSLAALAAYFVFVFRAQIGYRFALLPVALACLLAGIGLARLRQRTAIAAAVLVLAAAEHYPYLGNHLSFTNLVAWPKDRAYRLLGDSSIDYRQNADQAQAWVDAQPGAYLEPVHVLPGRNVFGITRLYSPEHDWVRRNREPQGHFRYSHVYFDLDREAFHEFLQQERRLTASETAATLCPAADDAMLPAAGDEIALEPPATVGQVVIVCIDNPQSAALVLRGVEGIAAFGLPTERRRTWPSIAPGQEVWFWAERGIHAVLMVAQKGSFRGRVEGGPDVRVWSRPGQIEKTGFLPGLAR